MIHRKWVICSSSVNIAECDLLADNIMAKYPDVRVIRPQSVPFFRTHNPEEKSVNRRYYFNQIADCDAIVVYTDNHIGIQTGIELGCGLAWGKDVYFSHNPTSSDQQWDEVKALLVDGRAKLLKLEIDYNPQRYTFNGVPIVESDKE